jgi:hypothetical protein
VSTKDVFVSTGSSIVGYNKEFAELKKMSKINGLTETGISSVGWSEETDALVIGYTSTNVDLFINNIIFNIPDIYNKYIPGNKQINRIRTNGRYAYLACSFGIVVVDISKKEIYDTWKPGPASGNNAVSDICFGTENIYAATETGVFFAGLSDEGLSYFGNWRRVNSLPDAGGRYSAVTFSGNRLFANKSDPLSDGDSLFIVGETTALFSFIPGVFTSSIDPGTGGFTVSAWSSARYYDSA